MEKSQAQAIAQTRQQRQVRRVFSPQRLCEVISRRGKMSDVELQTLSATRCAVGVGVFFAAFSGCGWALRRRRVFWCQ